MGKEGEAWRWRRRLLVWEARECSDLLTNIILQSSISDMGLWYLHASQSYNVTSAYYYLTLTLNVGEADHPKSIWNKEVPLKVSLFAWRLFRNRLPTMDNLSRRHILQHIWRSTLCGWVRFYGRPSSLILILWIFWENMGWDDILHWVGFIMVQPAQVADHFTKFKL